jgi:hypothetical protein
MVTEGNSIMHRPLVFILCALISIACLTLAGGASQPTIDEAAVKTAAAATAYVQLTKVANITVTPMPTVTPTATFIPWPTDRPLPTPLPTIAQTAIPGLLQQALVVESLTTFTKHVIKKVTGWEYGFNSFQWMGESYLRLSPIVGKIPNAEHSSGILTYPAAIDLNFGKAWIPKSASLRWSEGLRKIIVTREDTVEIYSLDGQLEKSYPGKLLSVSPSGTKLLFKDGTWLDLISDKAVKFAWDQEHVAPYSNRPVWSENENRVFVCCFVYGDAKTGESFDQWDNGAESEALGYGKWILNDRYLLAGTSLNLFVSPPLFDSSTKSIRTVGELAGIPTTLDGNDNMCNVWYIAPNGRYVWIACFDGSHLVDLTTFKAQHYPDYPLGLISDIDWSADGKFALVSGEDTDQRSFVRVLSVSNKELKPLPDNHYCSWWHPVDDILACRSKDTKTLSLLNVQAMSVQQKTTLPIEVQELIWSPDGKHIALLARDSSLWQIDYPSLGNLEQMTPPIPGSVPALPGGAVTRVKNVTWSPDGNFLAFIGGTDIYIVETQVKP